MLVACTWYLVRIFGLVTIRAIRSCISILPRPHARAADDTIERELLPLLLLFVATAAAAAARNTYQHVGRHPRVSRRVA